jgi:hypothetical protein
VGEKTLKHGIINSSEKTRRGFKFREDTKMIATFTVERKFSNHSNSIGRFKAEITLTINEIPDWFVSEESLFLESMCESWGYEKDEKTYRILDLKAKSIDELNTQINNKISDAVELLKKTKKENLEIIGSIVPFQEYIYNI